MFPTEKRSNTQLCCEGDQVGRGGPRHEHHGVATTGGAVPQCFFLGSYQILMHVMFIYTYGGFMRFPKMGVPPSHPLYEVFPL